MTTSNMSVAEVTNTAVALLCREIGPVNTARFINQFTTGFGDYTKERSSIVGDATVSEIVAEIRMKERDASNETRMDGEKD